MKLDKYKLADVIRLSYLKHGNNSWVSIADDTIKYLAPKKSKTFMFKNSIYTDYDEVVKWFKAHPDIAKRFSGVNVRFYIEAVGDWNDKQKNPTLRSNIGWVKTIKQFMTSDLLDDKLKTLVRKKKTTDYNPGNY